jgi:hypothetical protein
LCFQLPALVLEYGLTIIVTPIKGAHWSPALRRLPSMG